MFAVPSDVVSTIADERIRTKAHLRRIDHIWRATAKRRNSEWLAQAQEAMQRAAVAAAAALSLCLQALLLCPTALRNHSCLLATQCTLATQCLLDLRCSNRCLCTNSLLCLCLKLTTVLASRHPHPALARTLPQPAEHMD